MPPQCNIYYTITDYIPFSALKYEKNSYALRKKFETFLRFSLRSLICKFAILFSFIQIILQKICRNTCFDFCPKSIWVKKILTYLLIDFPKLLPQMLFFHYYNTYFRISEIVKVTQGNT